MKNNFIIFILGFCNIGVLMGELMKVPIKSHEILTKDITDNEVKSIYDNDMNTAGSFYHLSSKYVDVDFDLGSNVLIEKIVATIKSELTDIKFVVGNIINGQGGMDYICSKKTDSYNVHECIPKCQKDYSTRKGIISRKLKMSYLIKSSWASIYEIEVFARKKFTASNLISNNKLVLPDNCAEQPWLLTQSDSAIKPKSQKPGTKIFLEKSYIINEIDVIFEGKAPENLKIQLSNDEKKQIDITLDITKCSSSNSKFTCKIDRLKFPTRIVTLVSNDVVKLFLRGKSVFYPSLQVSTSSNINENLMLTCKVIPCDLSVHSDCSTDAIKSGVEFACSNKRLVRMQSGSDLNSFVIINHGKLEKIWSKTKFIVKSNTDKRMIVSMPRSYQYYGQYQCSCLVADELNTEITSKPTSLTESDFLENLIFKSEVLYKLDEDSQIYNKSMDNLIVLRQKTLKNTFIPVRVQSYSLIGGINMQILIPIANNENETLNPGSSNPENIKAFEDNSDSWSVNIYKYELDEAYPEFDNKRGIKINHSIDKYNLTQNIFVQFIRIDVDNMPEPEIIQTITDKSISIKVIYIGDKSIKLTKSEITCTNSENKEVALIKQNKCFAFNEEASCLKPDNVSMISISENRNIANKYVYSIIDNTSNKTLRTITVDNTLALDDKGIKINMKYVSLNSDPMKPEMANVDVEIQFVSKMIQDFIPCGKVLVSINTPGKPVKKMVLQKSKIIFPVSVVGSSVDLVLTLEIEGIKGLYKTVLNVINPTSLTVRNLRIQEKTKMILLWNSIETRANDLLIGYEVTTETTVIACNSTQKKVVTIKKLDNQNSYETELDLLSEKFSSKLLVSVQPLYKNGKRGQKKELEKLSAISKSTRLEIGDEVLPKQRIITLIPVQSDLPCRIKNVDFTLESAEVANQIKEIKEIGNLKYQINQLVPGRKYKLSARVNYNFGPSDTISEFYNFETADDVTINQVNHIAQVNDQVNITCIADLGPMDKYRKTIEWRRADNSPLPEGVLSVINPYFPQSAFLIMKKALADYSGDYGCFAKPAASFGLAKITIIINDLIVRPAKLKVDFTKSLEPISINCYSSTIGNGNLEWTNSDNLPISDKENDLYKIQQTITKEKAITSILTIKNPSLNTSGIYTCLKSIGEMKASQSFLLYGEEKLAIIVKKSSELIGEITTLRCKADLATKNQKVVWETDSIFDNNKKLVSTVYPNSPDNNIQDIEIVNNLKVHQVSCKIVPSLKANGKPKTKIYSLNLKPKIILDGPTNVTAGSNISLTCTGYPTYATTDLQWVFYNETSIKNTNGKVVLSSKNEPATKVYEPVKLVLSLNNVKNSESGRYECKFRTRAKTELLTSKSISLSVDVSNFIAVLNPCPDCPKKSAHTAYNFYLSKSVFISVIAFALFYLF